MGLGYLYQTIAVGIITVRACWRGDQVKHYGVGFLVITQQSIPQNLTQVACNVPDTLGITCEARGIGWMLNIMEKTGSKKVSAVHAWTVSCLPDLMGVWKQDLCTSAKLECGCGDSFFTSYVFWRWSCGIVNVLISGKLPRKLHVDGYRLGYDWLPWSDNAPRKSLDLNSPQLTPLPPLDHSTP